MARANRRSSTRANGSSSARLRRSWLTQYPWVRKQINDATADLPEFYQGLTEAFLAFARADFELSAPQSDGLSLREHYAGLAERTGRTHCRDRANAGIPAWLRDAVAGLHPLSVGARFKRFRPVAASWADLDAYQRLRFPLSGWEVEALTRADLAFMAEMTKRKPKG